MWSEALLGFYWDLALGSAITIAQFQITKAWHVVRVALFLNSVKEVEKSLGALNVSERKQLTEIHDAVYQAVYRRERRPWWKFW